MKTKFLSKIKNSKALPGTQKEIAKAVKNNIRNYLTKRVSQNDGNYNHESLSNFTNSVQIPSRRDRSKDNPTTKISAQGIMKHKNSMKTKKISDIMSMLSFKISFRQ